MESWSAVVLDFFPSLHYSMAFVYGKSAGAADSAQKTRVSTLDNKCSNIATFFKG